MNTLLVVSRSLGSRGALKAASAEGFLTFVASAVILDVCLSESGTRDVTSPPGDTSPSRYRDPMAFLKSFLEIPWKYEAMSSGVLLSPRGMEPVRQEVSCYDGSGSNSFAVSGLGAVSTADANLVTVDMAECSAVRGVLQQDMHSITDTC